MFINKQKKKKFCLPIELFSIQNYHLKYNINRSLFYSFPVLWAIKMVNYSNIHYTIKQNFLSLPEIECNHICNKYYKPRRERYKNWYRYQIISLGGA